MSCFNGRARLGSQHLQTMIQSKVFAYHDDLMSQHMEYRTGTAIGQYLGLSKSQELEHSDHVNCLERV